MTSYKGYKYTEKHKKNISLGILRAYKEGRKKGFEKGKVSWNKKPEGSSRFSRGYKLIKTNGRFIREHRLIIEQYLGRKLKSSEEVHHINGVKDDNRIENLIVMNKYNHAKEGKNYIEILQQKIRFLENKLKERVETI